MKASDTEHKEMKAEMYIEKVFEALSRLNQVGLKRFHGMVPPTVGPVQRKNKMKIFQEGTGKR